MSLGHAEGAHIDAQHLFHLVAVVGFHLPQADQLTHDLDVEAGGFGFGIDFLDVVGQGLFLFFQTFDPVDQSFQPLARGAANFTHAGLSLDCCSKNGNSGCGRTISALAGPGKRVKSGDKREVRFFARDMFKPASIHV
mgnify:CR=1 FL=1